MASLSSNQVDKIYDLLVDHKITLESLQIDLLDHLCCMVEQKMDNGLDFGKSLTLSIQEFGLQNLSEIQEATLYLLTLKLQKMKKVTSIIGIISAIFVIVGVLFKINHFPGASILLVLGIGFISVIVFPLMAFSEMQKGNNLNQKISVTVGYFSAIILGLATLFKIMHWPGSLLLSYSGFSLLVFVFIPFFTIRNYKTSENKLFALSKSLLILAGIIVFWGLIPLNRNSVKANDLSKNEKIEVQK